MPSIMLIQDNRATTKRLASLSTDPWSNLASVGYRDALFRPKTREGASPTTRALGLIPSLSDSDSAGIPEAANM